jgi:hypothetical protein
MEREPFRRAMARLKAWPSFERLRREDSFSS